MINKNVNVSIANVNTTPALKYAGNTNVQPSEAKTSQSASNNTLDTLSISVAAQQMAEGKIPEVSQSDRYQALASNQAVARSQQSMAPEKVDKETFLENAISSTLDQRLGVDREQLEQLQAQKEQIANDQSLTAQQKEDLIANLDAQIFELIREAAENAREQEQKQQQGNAVEEEQEKL